MDVKTWSLAVKEEDRLRLFQNKVLRGISEPKRKNWQEVRESYIRRNFITCPLHQMFLG
jgi:hypothetical protein